MNKEFPQVDISGILHDDKGRELTVKRAFDDIAAGQSDATLITAVQGKKLRVLALVAICDDAGPTTLVFSSGSTDISPTFSNAENGGEVLPYCQHGWFETALGAALNVTTGSGGSTGILVLYVEIEP